MKKTIQTTVNSTRNASPLAIDHSDCPTLEHEAFLCQSFDFFLFSWLLKHTKQVSKQVPHFSNVKKAWSRRGHHGPGRETRSYWPWCIYCKREGWRTTQNQLWQLRQPDPPLEFPGEQGIFIDMYAQVREEEQVISPQFTRNQEDVSMRRRKKRKQVEEGALAG